MKVHVHLAEVIILLVLLAALIEGRRKPINLRDKHVAKGTETKIHHKTKTLFDPQAFVAAKNEQARRQKEEAADPQEPLESEDEQNPEELLDPQQIEV